MKELNYTKKEQEEIIEKIIKILDL